MEKTALILLSENNAGPENSTQLLLIWVDFSASVGAEPAGSSHRPELHSEPLGGIPAVPMVKITGKYEGQLRTRSLHTPSGSALLTDAPVDNHGKGEAFSPTDLLATSLATCIVTTMAIVAERNGIDFSAASYEVIKEMTTTPPRRVATLTVRIVLPASMSAENRTRLEAVAKSCPVHHSLHPDVNANISFEYQ